MDLDKISPQRLDGLRREFEKEAERQPVMVRAMICLLDRIGGEWDSGQMETARHEELSGLFKKIKEAVTAPDSAAPAEAVRLADRLGL